jgi:hypothetical protein
MSLENQEEDDDEDEEDNMMDEVNFVSMKTQVPKPKKASFV